jgi:antitoxin component YwqK of YwqJK toxin-antitoxin module
MCQSEEPALHVAEIPYPSGAVRFRYARILSSDGKRWVRHGLFRAYSEDGELISEGSYSNGREEGLWRDFHENGQIAAEGFYVAGKEHGLWRFWSSDGTPERETLYSRGVEQAG